MGEFEFGLDAGHYSLFNIVQGAHRSLITPKNVQYPRVYI